MPHYLRRRDSGRAIDLVNIPPGTEEIRKQQPKFSLCSIWLPFLYRECI